MSKKIERLHPAEGVDEAQARLDAFVAAKQKAVCAGKDTVPALLAYLEDGLPMSAKLLMELADREHQHVVELIDNAVAEVAAAVRVRDYLIDESKMRDLVLAAGLVIDQSYTVLNAIDETINSHRGAHLRFAVRTLEVYVDRYQAFVDLVEPLPITEQVGDVWKEVSHSHSMVAFAQMSLQNHIDWQNAQAVPRRPL